MMTTELGAGMAIFQRTGSSAADGRPSVATTPAAPTRIESK
jgi:hypothetical protein